VTAAAALMDAVVVAVVEGVVDFEIFMLFDPTASKLMKFPDI
jgi:hypothetical protein